MSGAVHGEVVPIRQRRALFAQIADSFLVVEDDEVAVTPQFRLTHHLSERNHRPPRRQNRRTGLPHAVTFPSYAQCVVLTWLLVGGFVLLLAAAFVYAWRSRPYRGPGAEEDNAWRDEMALEASKFVNRSHDMGVDIGDDR